MSMPGGGGGKYSLQTQSTAVAGGNDKFSFGGVNYRTGGSNGLAISTPVLLGLAAAAAVVAIAVIKGK
ncbi:hypothetical protein [Bacterioplanoides sp.]|uniref:hypothetical protein n=1 Tax=Bacterioplanoides sp. TaxID=2066072 RepID=UPI003B0084FF